MPEQSSKCSSSHWLSKEKTLRIGHESKVEQKEVSKKPSETPKKPSETPQKATFQHQKATEKFGSSALLIRSFIILPTAIHQNS